jgi:hypothetical protein
MKQFHTAIVAPGVARRSALPKRGIEHWQFGEDRWRKQHGMNSGLNPNSRHPSVRDCLVF